MRRVVLLCGPPGSGKTTAARASGLEVFDRDDPHWSSEQDFRAALARIGKTRGAHAVVIRAGATSHARRRTAELIEATHTFLVLAPLDELMRRIRARGRSDAGATIAAAREWYRSLDRADGVRNFPGWAAILTAVDEPGVAFDDW